VTDHAPLPPSSAARWGDQCPGSATLERADANVTDEDAAEGHAAHWVAAEGLATRSVRVGTPAPNGVIVDDEMLEAAEMYVDDVNDQHKPSVALMNTLWHVEERVNCSRIHADNWGTPDLWSFTPNDGLGGLLLVYDFKYGHRFVDAFMNWQMIDYVAGIVERPEFIGLDHREITVIMNVVQPRNYHPVGPIRRWSVKLNELHKYFEHLQMSAAEATSENPPTRVGPECRDCKGRHACEALHLAADSVADIAGGVAQINLPPDALGVELRMLKRAQTLLDARVTGLEMQALNEIRSGKTVPFFMLEQPQGREHWTKPPEEIAALGAAMGVELLKPNVLITPAQARKAGLDETIVAGFSERPRGALKLVPANTTQTRKVFSK
jgi:hypothetical protein